MALAQPYYRILRPLKAGPNEGFENSWYIRDPRYAPNAHHSIRAFLLIQQDLERIFEYVEPCDANETAFSFRIHELLMRTCIELESNWKSILLSNGYKKPGSSPSKINIIDYRLINTSHRLSEYSVSLPVWGDGRTFRPFDGWSVTDGQLAWYQSYNSSKHNRQGDFALANLVTVTEAVAGLLAVLSSQFQGNDFSAGAYKPGFFGYDYFDDESAIGSLFRVKYPLGWSDDQLYDFNWSALRASNEPFQSFDYTGLYTSKVKLKKKSN